MDNEKEMNCQNCPIARELNTELRTLKDKVKEIEQQGKEERDALEKKIHGYRDFMYDSMEKFRAEIKEMNSNYQMLREAVLEIKSTVNSANEKTAMMFAQVTNQLNQVFNDKRDVKQYVVFPIIAGIAVAVIVGVLGFMAGKSFK